MSCEHLHLSPEYDGILTINPFLIALHIKKIRKIYSHIKDSHFSHLDTFKSIIIHKVRIFL